MNMMTAFEEHRSLLFSIAYRMLGTVSEAEEIVQETFLRLPDDEVQYPKAYLSQITTRLCLDYLKSAQQRREVYVGPWLPEPLIATNQTMLEPDKTVEQMDSISMAFMTLIEALSPSERAVFLLREVFDYDYSEIAHILEKDEGACRQLFSRAKKHLVSNRPRYAHDNAQHQNLVTLFLEACQTGSVAQLEQFLASEVVITVDGGGQVTAATRPVIGRDRVARFLQGILKHGLRLADFEQITVNNQVGLLGKDREQPIVLFILENDGAMIQKIWTIRNPYKLARLSIQKTDAPDI